MDVNLLFKDINIDDEGNVTFIKLDGSQYQDSVSLYTQLDMESIYDEYILTDLDDNFVLKDSYKTGTLAFFNNGNSYRKTSSGWKLMYRYSDADKNLSLDAFDSNKYYNKFDVFHHNGIKYYSLLDDTKFTSITDINIDFLNSEDVLTTDLPKKMYIDRFYLNYRTNSTYLIYDTVSLKLSSFINSKDGILVSNDSSIYLKDSVLYYNNEGLVENVINYCKYGNYVYTINSNNIVSKRRIGDLTTVLEEIMIDTSIQVTSQTLMSFGSESFSFYDDQTSSLSLVHRGEITTLVLPSNISMALLGDNGFLYFYNNNTQMIQKLQIFSKAIPFNSDFILNSNIEPNDEILSVELTEIYTSNIDNYLKSYNVDFKDITINSSGIIFGIGIDNFIYKIVPTSGSTFSTANSIIKSNFEISNMQSIAIIKNELYITQIDSLIIRQVDKETLNTNGVAFNMSSIGNSYIQSIAEGVSGDVGILTDTGVLYVYETLVSEPYIGHQLINFTNLTKVIPSDSRSFFATQLRPDDNTVYKVMYDSTLERPTLNANGAYRQLFTLSDSYTGLTLDKSDLGRLHALNVKTDLDNI